MWILLLLLVVLVIFALVGGMAYRGRIGAGGAASPQTTIVETGHNPEKSRTRTTEVTRETETIEE
jgi:hypothetical protein